MLFFQVLHPSTQNCTPSLLVHPLDVLNDSARVSCIGHSFQFCVVCERAEGTLYLIAQATNEIFFGTGYVIEFCITAGDFLPAEFHTTDHNAFILSAGFGPSHYPLI